MSKKKEKLGLFEEEIEYTCYELKTLLYSMADEVIEGKRNEQYLLAKIKFYEQLLYNNNENNNS